jgi:phosphoglycerate dehydrogenase-like enzyme
MPDQNLTLLIASPLEDEHVERIRATFPQVTVLHRPDLLGKARFVADHSVRPERTPEQEAEWRGLLAQADILFDFDFVNLDALPELAPRLKWIQATSAGIGQMVKRVRYAERTDWIFTTASGVHARPLAEFAIMAMIMFAKDFVYLQESKERRYWARYCGEELAGKTVAVIGLGKIGREVARLAKAFDMRVIGTRRSVHQPTPHVDGVYPPEAIEEILPQADVLVLSAPHTDDTERLLTAARLDLLPVGAVIVNVARGLLIDEQAMINRLLNGRLRGAALDVFEVEPLPQESPLWDMPNVIISPHSASTATSENGKIVDIFLQNLRHFIDGTPMVNVLDVQRLY